VLAPIAKSSPLFLPVSKWLPPVLQLKLHLVSLGDKSLSKDRLDGALSIGCN